MPNEDDMSTTEHAAVLRGLVTVSSPMSFEDTLQRLLGIIHDKGLQVFDVIDHAAAAAEIDLVLRPTRVVIFGSPAAGTPLMVEHPLLALELPLRILVWQDDGRTRLSYLNAATMASLFEIDPTLSAPLHAPEAIVTAATARGSASPP
jgi:uncharacterized protein (DUF302 family)